MEPYYYYLKLNWILMENKIVQRWLYRRKCSISGVFFLEKIASSLWEAAKKEAVTHDEIERGAMCQRHPTSCREDPILSSDLCWSWRNKAGTCEHSLIEEEKPSGGDGRCWLLDGLSAHLRSTPENGSEKVLNDVSRCTKRIHFNYGQSSPLNKTLKMGKVSGAPPSMLP